MTALENILPSDPEAEMGVISCIFASPHSIAKVQDMLTREDFCNEQYAEIFDAALSVFRQGKRCNMQNIVYELKRRDKYADVTEYNKVSYSSLVTIENSILQMTSIIDHATRLREVSVDRRMAILGYELFQNKCRKDKSDGEDYTIERAQQELLRISLGTSIETVSPMSDIMVNYARELIRRQENFKNNVANGVPTGFPSLDHLTGGLQRADLIILAARPSVGKTAFSLNIAMNIVSNARHALMFSLEMNKMALAQRLVAMETPMDQSMLRDGDLDDDDTEKVMSTIGRLSQVQFDIDDQTRKIGDIKSKARIVHSRNRLDLIVVDYLQLTHPDIEKGKYGNRVEEVAEISRGLKELASELNVPVLALAQLNRAIESRQNKIPQMSDLKESGSIEQDADVIMFLGVRDEELVKRMNGENFQIDVVVGKHRNGPVGQVALEFRPRSTRFSELAVDSVLVDDNEGYDD